MVPGTITLKEPSMIDYIPPTTVSASAGGGANLQGLDLITSVQILLVQDYDDQLRSMSNQMKGTTKVKQAYRKDIERWQGYLMQETFKVGKNGKIDNKNGKEVILMDTASFDHGLNEDHEYLVHEGGDLESKPSNIFGKVESYATKKETVDVWNPHTKKYEKQTKVVGYYVERDAIEKKIETVKLRLESLNEQSELMSLSLQSLANQRKVAFETISNLVNKEQEGIATIVRNIKS